MVIRKDPKCNFLPCRSLCEVFCLGSESDRALVICDRVCARLHVRIKIRLDLGDLLPTARDDGEPSFGQLAILSEDSATGGYHCTC